MPGNISISIVINVYNEEDNIADCLESLKDQTVSDFELVIVDDGSTDDTMGIVEEYTKEFDLKTYKLSHVGLRKARRLGFSKSSGDILVNIDADEMLREDFIENITSPFKEDEEIGGVGGVTISKGSNWAAESYGAWNEIFFELRGKGEDVDWIEGGCSAFRREAYEDVGGFTEDEISSDKDISWKLQKAGWKIVAKKNVVAYQKDPSTFRAVVKREHKNGRKEFYLLNTHEGKFGIKELSRFYPLIGILSLLIVPFFFEFVYLIGIGFLSTFLGTVYLVNSKLEESYFGISFKCWLLLTSMNLGWSIGFLRSLFGERPDL